MFAREFRHHDDPPTITTATVSPDSGTHPSAADSSAAGGSSSATQQAWSPPVQPQAPPPNDHVSILVDQAPQPNDHVSTLVNQAPPQDGHGPASQIYIAPPQAGNVPPQIDQALPQGGHGSSQVYIAPPQAGNVPPQIDQAPPQGGHGSSQVYIVPPQAGNAPSQFHYAPPKVDQGPPTSYSPGHQPPSKQPTGFMHENVQPFSIVTNPNVVAQPQFAWHGPAPPGANLRTSPFEGYVIPACLAIFFCAWPCAIPSLVYGAYANFLKAEGRTQAAQEKSKCARNWLIASVVTGVICIVIIVALNRKKLFNTQIH